jgi:RNA polymerase sigma-70 factor, ECF subfamily
MVGVLSRRDDAAAAGRPSTCDTNVPRADPDPDVAATVAAPVVAPAGGDRAPRGRELPARANGLIVREGLADDAALLARLRAGDGRAFEELVTGYQHRLFGVALRMLGSRAEAEEIAQETFLRAHRALGEFRGEARLGTWLYAIASRLCLNRLAAGPRRHERSDEMALLQQPAEGADAAAALERTELQAALHEAVAALPEERRIVVILRDLEGLAYEEIAEVLGLPLNTVRTRLHRARIDLKAKLERWLP